MAISSRAALWCVLVLLVAAYLGTLLQRHTLSVDSDILSLLPATEADPAIETAFARFSEQNLRRLVFLVAAADASAARQAADALAQSLRDSPWIASVQLRHDSAEQTQTGAFFLRYRHQLMSAADAALLDAGDVEAFSDTVIRQAYAPLSGGLIDLLATDPFLLSWRAGTASAGAALQQLRLEDSYLTARRGDEVLVLLSVELAESPFNPALQQQVLATLAGIEQDWALQDPGARLIRMGALFHTADAYASAKREITLIGGSSLLLVLVLLLLAFRSITPIVLVMLALGFGIGAGFAAVRLVFGEVHVLTIVFGSSLIGVAVDYAFHYFVITDVASGTARLARIRTAITLGLLTSVIGYAALLTTPFPGLQQMALFCIIGLGAAWLSVVLLFPVVPLQHANSPLLLRLCTHFMAFGRGRAARLLLGAALLLPLVAVGVLLTRTQGSDDIRHFQIQNAALLQQEVLLQSVLAGPAANQFVLVKGASAEALLQNLEATHVQLDLLVGQGAMDDYVSIAHWLPSLQQQQRNYARYAELYASTAGEALVAAGLVTPQQLASARATFAADAAVSLRPDAWLASPLGIEAGYLWLQQADASDTWAAVVALRGVRQLDLLDGLGAATNGQAEFVDKIATVNVMLAQYRRSVGLLLAGACAGIFLLLLWRYGPGRAGLIICSPLSAIAVTVLVLQVLGESVGLINVMALFLVVGIGVDFGIFFAEAGTPSVRTLLAVVLSALTTLFSFGLLALSATTVIHSFGLSMLIGISSVLLLAPVIGMRVAQSNGSQT